MSNSIIQLGPVQLATAAALVMALAGLTWYMRLALSRKLLIAATRTVIQLLLLGLVLEYLFATSHPALIALVALVMLSVAGREVMVRQHRPFKGWWGYGLGATSMFLSSFTIMLFALNFIIAPTPWYQPQYAIPLLGMMLGNTMSGVSLTLDHLTQNAWRSRAIIEARLMLGEDWRSATAELVRDSVRIGLIPIIQLQKHRFNQFWGR